MAEFDLIHRYFSSLGHPNPLVAMGVGDDAALLKPLPADQQLVFSMDTLVAGVHFPEDTSAHAVGHKAMAVNLSDMAAMGAQPVCALLSLTLPDADNQWCEQFAAGLDALASRYDVALIGGDTCRGPLSVCIQITGLVPAGQAVLRSGAGVGDHIFVTGHIGDAGAGLVAKLQGQQGDDQLTADVIQALEYPEPQIKAGLLMRGLASAAIDISDGLYQDLGHICAQSNCGARIHLPALPLTVGLETYSGVLSPALFALQSGDDYQLLFTVPPGNTDELKARFDQANMPLYDIGVIKTETSIDLMDENDCRVELSQAGYQHF